jgi:hypothetical protein
VRQKAFYPALSMCDLIFYGVFERFTLAIGEFKLAWRPTCPPRWTTATASAMASRSTAFKGRHAAERLFQQPAAAPTSLGLCTHTALQGPISAIRSTTGWLSEPRPSLPWTETTISRIVNAYA